MPRNKPCDAQHPSGGPEDSTSTMSSPFEGPKLTYKVPLCELKQGAPLAGPVGKRHPSLWSDSPSRDTQLASRLSILTPTLPQYWVAHVLHAFHRDPAHHSDLSAVQTEPGPAAPRSPGPQWFHSERSPGYPQGLPGVLPG